MSIYSEAIDTIEKQQRAIDAKNARIKELEAGIAQIECDLATGGPTLTNAQIITLAQQHGFLGAIDVVLDRKNAIQFARLVIEVYDKIREVDAC